MISCCYPPKPHNLLNPYRVVIHHASSMNSDNRNDRFIFTPKQ